MIKRSDKHGLSTIVATLIIILLVLVAVAIIWAVIRAFILKSTEEITMSKFMVDLKIDSARVDNSTNTISVKVKRNPGQGDLKGITFIIFDGQNSHIIERKEANFSLEELEKKTYSLVYTGQLIKISIAPMFETKSGKIAAGSITDVYYFGSGGTWAGSGNQTNCTSGCGTRECGPDPTGCQLEDCGFCVDLAKPYCNSGVCTASPCDNSCACAETLCYSQSCINACNNTCWGQISEEESCTGIECGQSACGDCGSCEDGMSCDDHICCATGYHNEGGICVVSCTGNCETRECGPVPNNCPPGGVCGDLPCDQKYNESYFCNLTALEELPLGIGMCQMCIGDCGIRECGEVPNGCGESCGECNASLKEICSSEGQCIVETFLDEGTIYSIWPIDIGIYFDSPDLPKDNGTGCINDTGQIVDYTDNYIKFTTGEGIDCLRIGEFICANEYTGYNMSYIKLGTGFVTGIQPNDTYEIWETYAKCILG